MFRFTIRELVLVTAVVVLVLGWTADARRVRKQLAREAQARGAMADTFVRWLHTHQYRSAKDADGRIEVQYLTWTEIIDPFSMEVRSAPARTRTW